MKCSRLFPVVVSCMLGLCSFSVRAEDDQKIPAEGAESNTPAEDSNDTEADKTAKAIDPIESLQRILGGMKLSAELIKKDEPETATKKTQPQVVKDLDELIKFLESQSSSSPPPPDSSPQPQQPMDQEPMPGDQKPQQKPQNSAEPGKEQSPSKSQDEAQSRESAERKQPLRDPRESKSLSGQQLYEKEVWGHLPPALRRELLNVYSEKYIPQYEDLVRRYYESLAEGNRRRNSSR